MLPPIWEYILGGVYRGVGNITRTPQKSGFTVNVDWERVIMIVF